MIKEYFRLSICDKFLILGSQRSGTSLLGMALEAHKNIELIEENNLEFHQQYALTKLIDLRAMSQYQSSRGIMTGFKAPRDSHRIKEFIDAIPDIKMIWISRNIYQVVASMITLRVNGKIPWATNFAPKEIIKYLYTYTDDYAIASSFSTASNLQEERKASVALATICWLSKNRCENHSCKLIPNQTFNVDYNKLVTKPEETLSSLLRFLELEFDPSVLTHSNLVSGNRPGGSSSDRDIDIVSIDKWKDVLSNEEIQMIDTIVEQIGNDTVSLV